MTKTDQHGNKFKLEIHWNWRRFWWRFFRGPWVRSEFLLDGGSHGYEIGPVDFWWMIQHEPST